MGRKLQKTTRFPLTPSVLLRAVANPDFELACAKSDETNKEVTMESVEQTGTGLVMLLRNVEYARTTTGSLDKSRTVLSSSRVQWDLAKRTGRFDYTPSSEMTSMTLCGTYLVSAVEGAPNSADLTVVFEVSVSWPLIGGLVEKMVLNDIDSKWDRCAQFASDIAARLP
ncbi:hypothetical protein Pelo_9359 [Pelomyxa schiedti]|nr:hypothetical protein Pelo_9359 [Pelomyxa schiedti]